MMTPERWEQVGKIFDAAAALPPEERSSFLDQACQEDDALRREVESLLTIERQAGDFLDSPAMEDAARLLAREVTRFSAGTRAGNYEVLEFLDSGGMGDIYKARHVTLKNLVALKFLPTAVAQDSDRLRRFKQEARAASALNHPNIVTVHDFVEAEQGQFIVTEYVEGSTLRQLLGRGRMALTEVIDVATQIATALVTAHTVGVIHRDIKPENIMVRRDRLVKLLDFGLAKLSDTTAPAFDTEVATQSLAKSEPGRVIGTLTYMSPEQVRGVEVDARTDIWSLGVVLYEMITGQAPFTGETGNHIAVAILDNEPAPVSRLAPNASSALQRIVRKSLAKDRQERYQTARDLLIDLKSLNQDVGAPVIGEPANDLPEQSGGLPSSQRTTNTGQPIRKFFVAAAVLVCLLFTALVAWNFQNRPSTDPPLIAVPLTTDPGFEGMPSLSPDGNYVAFTAGGGEQQKEYDLYVKQIGSSAPALRLTSGPAVDEFPAWSPDGRSIAFTRPKGQTMDVFLISPLGGPERKVAETRPYRTTGELDWNANYLAWTPDSQYLVMADQASATEPYSLFVFSVATGDRRRLTTPQSITSSDRDPAISPDGRLLSFVRSISPTNSQLYLLPLSEDYGPAGEARRLNLSQPFVLGPAWTSDGLEIIYSTGQQAGSTRLWRVPLTGSDNPQPLAAVGENGSHPTISRHGNRLVYANWKWDVDIWRLELSGAKPDGLLVKLIASTQVDENPQYSLDGSRIAFTSDRSGHTEIWVAASDGSNAVQLTSLSGSAGGPGSPQWFPDGRRLVFELHKDGQAHSYSIDVDDRVPKRLTNDVSDDLTPSVSHDGKWIYFASKRTGGMEIYRLPAEGGEAVQVTHNGGVLPRESPDGKVIYYAKPIGETDLLVSVWQVPASGGEETRLLGPVWISWFTVVRDGIFFIDSGKEPYAAVSRVSLQFYRFATATAEKVSDLKFYPGGHLSVSPDGRYVLLPLGDPEVCDLKLVENFR